MDEGGEHGDAQADGLIIVLLQNEVAFPTSLHHHVFPIPQVDRRLLTPATPTRSPLTTGRELGLGQQLRTTLAPTGTENSR
jgi:hypothetical protein